MRHSLFAAALIAGLASSVAAQAPAPAPSSISATVDRAVAAWGRVRTARADFVQVLTNPLTGGSMTARGEYQQQRPGRIAIRFSDPAGDMVVADGQHVWVYLPSSAPGQVMRRPGTAGSVPIDLAGQFLDSPRTRFDIADGGVGTVDGASARILLLVPKAGAGAPFTRAKVWVLDRDATIRQFEVTEASGVVRNVRLTSLELNGAVNESAFRFTVPRGARVVEAP